MEIQREFRPRTMPQQPRRPSSSAWIRAEDRQLQRMLKVGFVFFLVPTALGRLVWWHSSAWPEGPGERKSIIAEAKDAAATFIPLGFMGW